MKKGRIDASMKVLLPRPPKPEQEKRQKSLRDIIRPRHHQGPQTEEECYREHQKIQNKKGEMYGMVARNH